MSDKTLEELKKELGVAWDAYDAVYGAYDDACGAYDAAYGAHDAATVAAAARDAYHKKLKELTDEDT